MKPPTRFNKDSEHHEFGIKNWFLRINFKNQELQNKYIDSFLLENGYKKIESIGKKKNKAAKFNFIHNRFQIFSQYILKQIN